MRSLLIAISFFGLFIISAAKGQGPVLEPIETPALEGPSGAPGGGNTPPSLRSGAFSSQARVSANAADSDLGQRAVPVTQQSQSRVVTDSTLESFREETVVEGPLFIQRLAYPSQRTWVKSKVVIKVPPRPSLRHRAVWVCRGESSFRVNGRVVFYPLWEAQWVAATPAPVPAPVAVDVEETEVATPVVVDPVPVAAPSIVEFPLVAPPAFSTTTVVTGGGIFPLAPAPMVVRSRQVLTPRRQSVTVKMRGVLPY